MEVILDPVRGLLNLLLPAAVRKFLDNDHVALVHRGDKVGRTHTDILLHQLQDIPVAVRAVFDNNDHAPYIRHDAQLLGPAVNINQKEVVQEQILHETVLVIALLEGSHQTPQLKSCHPAHEQGVIALAPDNQDILQLLVFQYFKKLKGPCRLRVCGGNDKIRYCMNRV